MMMDYNSFKKTIDETENVMIEGIVMMAKLNRLYFEELVSRGFEEDEALELTKAHGLNMTGGSNADGKPFGR